MTKNTPSLKPKFKPPVRRQEAEFAGFRCSFRGCGQPAYGPAQKKVEGQTDDEDANAVPRGQGAHIFSSSPNGPRGQGGLNEDKLAGANNCLHVCPNCHNLIDAATSEYPVDTLVEMKWLHRTIVKVINLYHHLESRLIKGLGTEGSDRYQFEEFLLDKVPKLEKVDGAVPSKPKIDEKTLAAYVNEFFTERKLTKLEFTEEEREAAAKKLEKIYRGHWEPRSPKVSMGLEFSYTLIAIRTNGDRIRSGETYRFYRNTSSTITLFQQHREKTAELSHEIGFDITGSYSSASIEFDINMIRISTNFNTVEFLHALSESAKIYYDVEVQEVIDGIHEKPFKLNKGEIHYRWSPRFSFFSNLKYLYSRCFLVRAIADEFGIKFLPQINITSSKGGVRPNDVSGLLAPELNNDVLRSVFSKLSNGSTRESVKLRSNWNIEHEGFTGHIAGTLDFSNYNNNCNIHTYLFLVIEPSDPDKKTELFYLPDDELLRVDYITEMCKPAPEGEILQQLKAFIRRQ